MKRVGKVLLENLHAAAYTVIDMLILVVIFWALKQRLGTELFAVFSILSQSLNLIKIRNNLR